MILREEQAALFRFGFGFFCAMELELEFPWHPRFRDGFSLWIKRQKIKWHRRGVSRELRGEFFFPSLIQQNGNGLLVFPNANNNNCSDRFVIASIDFLPQHKLFLKMPLNGILFAGRVGISDFRLFSTGPALGAAVAGSA